MKAYLANILLVISLIVLSGQAYSSCHFRITRHESTITDYCPNVKPVDSHGIYNVYAFKTNRVPFVKYYVYKRGHLSRITTFFPSEEYLINKEKKNASN